jgi:nucleoside-diphosphate-sugar epimerase
MAFTVIGATGFVGAHLARHVAGRGIVCHRPPRGDPGLLRMAHDHIVYCAGYTSDFLAAPAETVEAHVGLLTDLLRHGRFETLTYLSSTRLYDFADGGTGHEGSALRLDPNRPRHLFDLSKALGESLCINGGRDGVRAVRLSSVYADDLAADNFLHHALRAARAGQPAAFDVAPDTARDYIHIEDVCSALVDIARRGRRPLYNLASGVNIANAELFGAVERLTGVRLTASKAPAGVTAPIVDISAIREDLGVRPVPLQGRLARLLHVPALGAA